MQLKANDKTFDLLEASERDEMMAGHRRKVLTLVLNGTTYADVAAALTDGATLTIVDEQGHDNVITDRTKAGAITDNRDGTITAKMGAENTTEQDLQDEVKTVTERADKAANDTVTLAGRPVNGSDDVSALRITFEQAAAKLSDSDATIAPSLSEVWNPFREVTAGERRYYAPNGKLYKCLKDHKTDFTNAPDVSLDHWFALN